MLVKVTKEDIRKADRLRAKQGEDLFMNICSCPIAQAVRRQTHRGVMVDGELCHVSTKGQYSLPIVAKVFVYAWDESKKVKPFSFEMTLESKR